MAVITGGYNLNLRHPKDGSYGFTLIHKNMDADSVGRIIGGLCAGGLASIGQDIARGFRRMMGPEEWVLAMAAWRETEQEFMRETSREA